MTSAAESSALFLSALASPVHSILPNLGMCKLILDTKLLNPFLISEPSPNSIGDLREKITIRSETEKN